MNDTVFATGAFVRALEVEINGKKQWRWIVDRFEDENFQNGKSVDIYEYADSFESLFQKSEKINKDIKQKQ